MESKTSTEALPMNSGDGEYSYAKNSTLQRSGADLARNMIKEAILEKLDIETLSLVSSNVFNIADLGCSVGPNTFSSVQNIIESVELKLQSHKYDKNKVEFHVFYNDQVGNDFNTLLQSLPVARNYYAAAVPGSFHGRLFTKSTIHFMHSSYTLHWLSRVPDKIVNKSSDTYNKGKIYFTTASDEVSEAYTEQFVKDLKNFLDCRAIELVSGGLLVLITPCVPSGSVNRLTVIMNIMGDALFDLATQGLLSEELVDSFNLPMYFPTLEELKMLIEIDANFSIEKIEPLTRPRMHLQEQFPNIIGMHFRAAWEGLVRKHFGVELVDQVFKQFNKKLIDSPSIRDSSYQPVRELFILLKRQ